MSMHIPFCWSPFVVAIFSPHCFHLFCASLFLSFFFVCLSFASSRSHVRRIPFAFAWHPFGLFICWLVCFTMPAIRTEFFIEMATINVRSPDCINTKQQSKNLFQQIYWENFGFVAVFLDISFYRCFCCFDFSMVYELMWTSSGHFVDHWFGFVLKMPSTYIKLFSFLTDWLLLTCEFSLP